MKTRKYSFWLLIGCLITTQSFYAQNYRKLDSIINVAGNEIYVNPDHVIEVGQSIVKNAGDNVNYKIKGYI